MRCHAIGTVTSTPSASTRATAGSHGVIPNGPERNVKGRLPYSAR